MKIGQQKAKLIKRLVEVWCIWGATLVQAGTRVLKMLTRVVYNVGENVNEYAQLWWIRATMGGVDQANNSILNVVVDPCFVVILEFMLAIGDL